MSSGVEAEIVELFNRKITQVWNDFVTFEIVPLAKEKCPFSVPFRRSQVVGTGQRKYPQRLTDTIYAKDVGNGLLNVASDDERALWMEKGTREHAINATDSLDKGGLRWKTRTGKTVKGWYGVLHPGINPQAPKHDGVGGEPLAFLFPALYEAGNAKWSQILGEALQSDTAFLTEAQAILDRYGIQLHDNYGRPTRLI